jgi:uncharacterized protein (DUF983 family)
MTEPQVISKGQPSIAQAALFGLCPECSAKTLFAGPIEFATKCGNCGLDYSTFNVGDGPAALLTMVLGALVIAMAMTLESVAHPPFWVHAVIWIPLTAALVRASLRLAKGALLIAEHRNKAKEGELADSRGEA